MSNWFENNPTKSVIGHTIIVFSLTWASFVFVFDENKDNVHKAEVASLEAQVNQYRAKVEVIESQISFMKSENSKLQTWLINTPKTIPNLQKTIESLVQKNQELEKYKIPLVKQENSIEKPDNKTKLYSKSSNVEMGSSFVDPLTLTSLGINHFNSDFTADIYLKIPNQEGMYIKSVKPGTQWDFEYNKKKYTLILSEANWYTNTGKVSLIETVDKPQQ